MGDSNFSEYLFEFGINAMDTLVKQEPVQGLEMGLASASVPIPGGHRGTRGGYDQLSPSPIGVLPIWGTRTDQDELQNRNDSDPVDIGYPMEDDDIFQVDKADLIQSPTLAELNCSDDILLGDLNFDDLILPPPDDRLQPFRADTIIETGGTLFSGGLTNFTPGSCPQSAISYRNYTPYTTTSAFSYNGIGIIDNLEAVSPPAYPSPSTSNFAGSSTASSSISPHPIVRPTAQSTLHELLMRKAENVSTCNPMDTSSPMETGATRVKSSWISTSAPAQSMGLDQLWARREPREHLVSTSSTGVVEAGSTSSLSTGSALSPDPPVHIEGLGQIEPLSHDEDYDDTDYDSDRYSDYTSDNESGGSDGEDQGSIKGSSEGRKPKSSKEEKYFWQYNVQAKGPKGQRLVARARLENPHILNQPHDPVFSPQCALRGIKHSGKARKGDGNDLTPNPRKLYSIGRELDKLARVINDMTPVSELPFTARPKTRKEKNKLASRACRLKKKAQHEANKIKLHGLEQEHKRLIQGIAQMKGTLAKKLADPNVENQEDLTRQMDKIVKSATKVRIASHSTDFVNKVLDKVKSGVADGGIDDF
ncbi:uncharacterized protein REPTOR isoform X2 [Fopius arisanus]|uniref:CG13624_0 protein n=1 Tax=Fopius arisanus TaxID=64838 RepID=A0A0C9RE35_9HYME|nr:PREDICTED: uncharacterized protein LOC105270409 isoform X2 [Fopius arisanus]